MVVTCHACGMTCFTEAYLCIHYYTEHTVGVKPGLTHFATQGSPTPCPWCLEMIDFPRVTLNEHLSGCALYLAWHVRGVSS